MAMDELGPTLDLHCGGIDLIFPHHEDEIAQSEGATGVPFSRFWCHGAFLLTEGAKMAKRVGNVWTVSDLRSEKISPFAVRHFVFSTHYRKELNLVREALDASAVATRRLGAFKRRLALVEGGGTDGLLAAANQAEADLRKALLDDLNGPEAMAALFTFVRQANHALETPGSNQQAVSRARDVLNLFDLCLGVVDDTPVGAPGAVSRLGGNAELAFDPEAEGVAADELSWLGERLAARAAARKGKRFAESDSIRQELSDRGFLVEDSAGGQVVRRKN